MTKTNALKPGKKFITAAAGGAGKSTLAMLMASTALNLGKKIDIFDADPANPTARRYYKSIPSQNLLEDDRPEALVRFLEERVFADDNTAMLDLGANMEGTVLRWMGDRGAVVAPEICFIVPVSKRDGIKAASRIALNRGEASVLLVINEAGPDWEAAAADPAFKHLVSQIGQPASLPHLGPTMEKVHATSMPPHLMAKSEHRFERQGGINLLRKIEYVFLDHPDFRPW